jgi:protein SCO1/2
LAAGALILLAAALAAGCGSSGDAAQVVSTGTEADHAPAQGGVAYEGGVISPRRAAPPLRLRDIDGKTVDIKRFEGRPVLVTFVYSHCPDVCPLIMQNIKRARADAGALGARTKVIAVSVDPKGDTPAAVRQFLDARGLLGQVSYLIGSRPRLEKVWDAWQIAQRAPRDNPELVEHSGLIYGITASGQLATAYPVNFDAAAIARDLPLLAKS